ncbi:hypothetical protein HY490_02580 [Candidatus Woesearchaeota archaeon]|nr:hypothetical protein [Candidatus Woesearchaeota archaeon]
MWPFGKHLTAQNYLKHIVTVAQALNDKIADVYETYNPAPFLELLDAIDELDQKGRDVLAKETGSAELTTTFMDIRNLTGNARTDAREKDFTAAHNILNRIIDLASTYTAALTPPPVRTERPSKELSRILSYNPEEALSKGYVFRGLSDHEWERKQRRLSIFSKNPTSKGKLIAHLIDPSTSDQFISLTTDVETAKKFGHIVALRKEALKGELLDPDNIEQQIKGDTRAKKFQRKNTEFILAPAENQPAEIPADAVVV